MGVVLMYSFTDVYLCIQQPYGIADGSDQPARYSADDVLSAKNMYTGGAEANGLPGGYTSDSTHDYGNGGYSTNPYKKIPPIPTSSGSDGMNMTVQGSTVVQYGNGYNTIHFSL